MPHFFHFSTVNFRSPKTSIRAFTLVELLVVIGIMVLMMGLLGPAMNAIKGAGDVTKAAYDISGLMEGARSYAMANNTYTWVGFYEENAGALTATATKPAYSGKGRVVMAAVYAKDGTTSCQDSSSTSASPKPLTPTLIAQLGKLIKVENVHMTDLSAPPSTPTTNARADSLDVRSDLPFTVSNSNFCRINSDSSDTTLYPFAAQGYTFYKTIRFNPRGESNLNSTYTMKRVAEIGLRPTHGTTVDSANPNVVAIQITGVAGEVKIYRR